MRAFNMSADFEKSLISRWRMLDEPMPGVSPIVSCGSWTILLATRSAWEYEEHIKVESIFGIMRRNPTQSGGMAKYRPPVT
jgi:hypothetical protein